MIVKDVIFAPGMGAFFYDDQAAIRAGRDTDGFVYLGAPITPGFDTVRKPGTSLGIGLVLGQGTTAWGDMMSVQYAGAGGRDPLFDPVTAQRLCEEVLLPRLNGLDVTDFRAACRVVLAALPGGKRLPLSIEYGASQALLAAAAAARKVTMAEVVAAEFSCPVVARRVPIYAQSGDDRRNNVDKMILKSVDILPHGLINSRSKFGERGEVFLEYVDWVARRVERLGQPAYKPVLHFDVYGWVGLGLGLDVDRIADFMAQAAERAAPFDLQIESPADFGSRQGQIDGFIMIMEALARKGCRAKIVADEWCNTLDDVRAFTSAGAAHLIQIKMPDVGSIADSAEAVLLCKRHGIGAYLGGSCVETDLSARIAVHIAVATGADMILAKPGMGVDEAISIVGNEQSRLLAELTRKEAANVRGQDH
ncbi:MULTISPECIES: methylaspartate ammonia-lyase [Phyllobacteriaceae]|jgi:methylaspartate ammonia-lyase|uniref:methylaspartate ammonia-lyase n=1 Tax=Mesorhizobium hungaricum TaxID=1566387 RepID=A0A1C2DVW3_9HYPH|nr:MULTISPECIES: methylaspartate ammonia-lyase [Mesorhizobium]MBN9233933.1 methylaspartate ammonia-lyase [Mesorhizobium sp.]MDQ0331464.1 methylaspartate ammonia-lyase [Mesorhizobium sp. YL-MeA3-2017]OCX18894.1 methylaspartate ammonia-lyase [Mesorhizobium hungaricum]